jgi:anti-sigma factor (TIGR02949 family)
MSHDQDRSSCIELFARLSEYMDGELPENVCAEFDGHFENCPRCIRFIDSMRRAVRHVESVPCPELPQDLRQSILDAASELKGE